MQNVLRLIPLADITVLKTGRQRKEITPETTYPLACAIAQQGLLQNIGITSTYELIFGERRFRASCYLWGCSGGPASNLHDLTRDQIEHLCALATANPQYDNWSKIPTRISKLADTLDLYAMEFIENVSREDLPWQDRSDAAWHFHHQALNKAKAASTRWTDRSSAAALGIDQSYFSKLVEPHRQIATATSAIRTKLERAVKLSKSPVAAINATKTIKERHGEATVKRPSFLAPSPPPPVSTPPLTTPIICADFTEWVETYSAAPFNFIHCDFPYGIDFNKSEGQSTSAATTDVGTYDDGPEVYWHLLKTLFYNREKLLAPSSHVMLWLSMNNYDETKQQIPLLAPEAEINPFPLIWHMSDNAGLAPAPQYSGRRTYEAAIQISFGQRKIAGVKNLSISHPRSAEKIHRSQKQLAVLSHFFGMYVDSSSRVLDPTCGSGSAIIAAHKLNAAYVLGLEKDPETAKNAQQFYAKKVATS